MKTIGWRKLKEQVKDCTVKAGSTDLWIGKRYWFVDMQELNIGGSEMVELVKGKFVAEKMLLVDREEETVRKSWRK